MDLHLSCINPLICGDIIMYGNNNRPLNPRLINLDIWADEFFLGKSYITSNVSIKTWQGCKPIYFTIHSCYLITRWCWMLRNRYRVDFLIGNFIFWYSFLRILILLNWSLHNLQLSGYHKNNWNTLIICYAHEFHLHTLLTHCGLVDLRKWTIFNTIQTSPKSWLSQEDLVAGCEHSLVPMDSWGF